MNLLFNIDRAELEQALKIAQEEFYAGKTQNYWQGSDMAASKHVWDKWPPDKRIEVIGRELSRRYPEDYPPGTFKRVSVVLARFKDR